MSDILTVRETVERAKIDGLPVSEFSLRRWIKTGQLPVRMCGRKALVFYPALVSFVTCANGQGDNPKPPATSGDELRGWRG